MFWNFELFQNWIGWINNNKNWTLNFLFLYFKTFYRLSKFKKYRVEEAIGSRRRQKFLSIIHKYIFNEYAKIIKIEFSTQTKIIRNNSNFQFLKLHSHYLPILYYFHNITCSMYIKSIFKLFQKFSNSDSNNLVLIISISELVSIGLETLWLYHSPNGEFPSFGDPLETIFVAQSLGNRAAVCFR